MKTKIKVLALSIDTENCGTEVEIFKSEQEFLTRLELIMEDHMKDCDGDKDKPKVEAVQALLDEKKVMAAWDVWRDTLMPDMDVYVWEEQEIEVDVQIDYAKLLEAQRHLDLYANTETEDYFAHARELIGEMLDDPKPNRVLLEVQGGVVQTVYADREDTRVVLLDHDAGEVDGERELENKEVAKAIPDLKEVRLYCTAGALNPTSP